MEINRFIKTNFQVTTPYTWVNSIKNQLLKDAAIVVMEEDADFPLGVLTPIDIVQRPYNLVIDCLSEKPFLNPGCNISTAFHEMKLYQTNVLPVSRNDRFIGLVFKEDLFEYANSAFKKQGKILEEVSLMQTHQLRSPLANILGIVKMLDKKEFSHDNRKTIEMLEVSSENFDRIIKSIILKANNIATGDVGEVNNTKSQSSDF